MDVELKNIFFRQTFKKKVYIKNIFFRQTFLFNKVFLLLYHKWEIFYKNVVKLKIII